MQNVLKGGICMKRIIDEIFRRQKLIIMLFVIILGYGVYSYFVIPKQEMPEINTPYMLLSVTAPSMSASDIEEDVLTDIEKVIMTFPEVTDVRSTIYDNYAVVITTFSFSTDNPLSLSETIYDKVLDLSLSDNISDISYSSNFDDPHVIFALHSPSLSEVELQAYSEEFKNEILLIDEVKEVQINSVFNKEIVITLNTDLLNIYGLNMYDIYQIIYANSSNIPLGGISTVYGTISVSGEVSFDEITDLQSLIIIPEIPTVTTEVTLGDLSTIELKDTSSKFYEFDGNQAIFLSIYFDKNIDFTKMGTEILNAKDEFLIEANDSTLLIDEMLFLPDYVNSQINNVVYSLVIAIAVVMVVVLVGIGIRNSLLVVVTIPVIIFATLGVLFLSGQELHKLTIVGMIVAIGILVDNQIVITEGIKRNIELGMEKVFAAKTAIKDNFGPVLSSTLTTVAAFIVIVLLPGFLGEIVSSMPLTVIITISFSFIVSMTLSPVLAVIFLKAKPKADKINVHEIRIKKMIENTIKYPLLWLFISIVTLGGSVYFAFTTLDIDLYPNDERAIIYIDFEGSIDDPASTNIIKDEIVDIISQEDSFINFASSIGGNLPSFHFSAKLINEQPHIGRIYVNYDMTENELLDYKSSLEISLSSINPNIRINTLELSPPVAPIRMFIQSDDSVLLDSISSSIFDDIIDEEYIKSYKTTANAKSLKYNISYDYDLMSSTFISKLEIDSLISMNLNGLDLNIYEFNSELINVNINSDIQIIEDLDDLLITSSVTDSSYPLSSFITVTEIYDYAIIQRLDGQGVAIIDVYPNNIDNFKLQSNLEEIASAYNTTGVKITYGGENEMFEEISTDLIRASVIALILIFIVMFIQFNNFVKPLIVYLTIPLSFTGSFLFLIIFNSPITATSLVGMVSLLGVTVNTGILLVEYISRSHHGPHDIREACVNAVYLRFRPIMLTSITTILGLIPLLITGGNFFRPLAITFMGGLVTSTVITIFLVPSVYYMIYKNRK